MRILHYLENAFNRQHEHTAASRKRRVRHQVFFEPLENRTSLSQVHIGAPSSALIFVASQARIIASDQSQIAHVAGEGTQLRATSRAGGPIRMNGVTSSPAAPGYGRAFAATVAPDDSGKVEPKDPGGIELVRVAR